MCIGVEGFRLGDVSSHLEQTHFIIWFVLSVLILRTCWNLWQSPFVVLYFFCLLVADLISLICAGSDKLKLAAV